MAYLLLTGGTGLLGSYLIRDLLKSGTNLALLVRSTRKGPARARAESVISRWEAVDGRILPRPVVLEGDLSEDNLGLDQHDIDWIGRNCDAVMHNAASLTFYAAGRDDEPWRSNLYGTERVLDLCRRTGIRQFHHVSTAYVCGLRSGRVLESELEAGQTHGNDYEVSKYRAELLVRQADFLDAPTIYRPGIILGDSQSGYTSTFYGFYVPLKLLSTLLTKAAAVASTREELIEGIRFAGRRLTEILNLTDNERKNYVPVDWVSAVMAHIAVRPQLHGQTYHLTPNEPVSLRLTREVTEQAFEKYTELAEHKQLDESGWADFEKYFIDGMKVYQSYWRDDPVFDTANTLAAAPHLPCPVMDADFFMRICQFAIESNFGRRTGRSARKPSFDAYEKLQAWMTPSEPVNKKSRRSYVGLRIDGAGGGQWELALSNGRLVYIDQGISDRCTATFHLNSQTFAALASESTTAQEGVKSGRIGLKGNGLSYTTLVQALEDAVTGPHGVHAV